MTPLRIGTRGSALALAQAHSVAERIGAATGEAWEVVTITTSGDRGARGGDKSRWVDTIEAALLANEVDIAVHSAKDVPGELASGTELVGADWGAHAWDVLIGAPSLDDLPAGVRIGTSSLRRQAQVLLRRQDLEVVDIRGNVDTRLGKLENGEVDALILAEAGLERLGRTDVPYERLLDFVWAPGQGILALQGREGDQRAAAAGAIFHTLSADVRLRAERAAVRALGASCHTPVGVAAHLVDGRPDPKDSAGVPEWHFFMDGFAGLPDGSWWIEDTIDLPETFDSQTHPERLGEELARRMISAGARELFEAAEAMAR